MGQQRFKAIVHSDNGEEVALIGTLLYIGIYAKGRKVTIKPWKG